MTFNLIILVFSFFSFFPFFPTRFSTFPQTNAITEPFPKQQILDTSIMKETADNNFEFDEQGRKFSKKVENTL